MAEITRKETIIRVLEALFPGVQIVLFGSRARGTNRPSSDIDLAIDAGRPLTISELAEARRMLAELNIVHTIDVVDMHTIADDLRETIRKEGVPWQSSIKN